MREGNVTGTHYLVLTSLQGYRDRGPTEKHFVSSTRIYHLHALRTLDPSDCRRGRSTDRKGGGTGPRPGPARTCFGHEKS